MPVTDARTEEFERIFAEQFDSVHTYVRYLVRNPQAAEDLVADVFAKAFERFASYDREKGDVRPWLRAIARNTVSDYLRARSQFAAADVDSLEDLRDEQDIETDYEDRETAARLLRLTRTLPVRDQQILAMKFFLRMTNREIAAQTGLSESNVGTILHRVLRVLRKKMNESDEIM